jgi:hypothetical protein
MKWFRFYHEVYRDPKVKRMRPELFKFWVQFLCVASESKVRGTIESDDHLACALGMRRTLVERLTSELEAANLLVRSGKGTLQPFHWSEKQPKSDDQPKRKKDKRQSTCENGCPGPEDEDEENVPVHVPIRDIDLDTDIKEKNILKKIEPDGLHSTPDIVPIQTQTWGRQGQDGEDWRAAIAMLDGNGLSDLARRMEMDDGTPTFRNLEGWRFLHAARVVVQPAASATHWGFFRSIFVNASRRDLERFGKPKSVASEAVRRQPPAPRTRRPLTDAEKATNASHSEIYQERDARGEPF